MAARSMQLTVASSVVQRSSLRIVTTSSDSLGRPIATEPYPVNTRSAVLLPTYAEPDARHSNVLLRTSAEDQLDATYQFQKLKDLHKFQQCLTDFEVKCDQENIVGVRYKHSGLRALARMKHLSEHHDVARAQIWYHSPLVDKNRSPIVSPVSSSPDSRTNGSISPRLRENSGHTSRRHSQASTGQSQPSLLSAWTSRNAPSSCTPRLDESNNVAEIPTLDEPKIVLLMAVIDLSNTDPQLPRMTKTLRSLVVPLRAGVHIDTTACQCHHNDQCRELVIRSSGSLDAKLYDYKNNLSQWDLVVLGQSKHKDAKKFCTELEDLDRLVIKFEDHEQRQNFGQMVGKTVDLYEQRRMDREKLIRRVQREDIVR